MIGQYDLFSCRERKEMLVTSSPAPTVGSLKISSSVSSLINQNIRHLYIYSETQVESPLSPHNSSAPASLSQGVAKALQGLHLEEQAGLLIEEVLFNITFTFMFTVIQIIFTLYTFSSFYPFPG